MENQEEYQTTARSNGARKDDTGKERFDLVAPSAMMELARVYTVGAGRYAPRNWEKGMAWGRIFAAAMRHLWKFWRGEDVDAEDGIHHAIHAAWCCLTLYEYWLHHVGEDDRSELGRHAKTPMMLPTGLTLDQLTVRAVEDSNANH